MAKNTNQHVTTATEAFANWTQARRHAQQLLDDGEITQREFNAIKAQTGGGKKPSRAAAK